MEYSHLHSHPLNQTTNTTTRERQSDMVLRIIETPNNIISCLVVCFISFIKTAMITCFLRCYFSPQLVSMSVPLVECTPLLSFIHSLTVSISNTNHKSQMRSTKTKSKSTSTTNQNKTKQNKTKQIQMNENKQSKGKTKQLIVWLTNWLIDWCPNRTLFRDVFACALYFASLSFFLSFLCVRLSHACCKITKDRKTIKPVLSSAVKPLCCESTNCYQHFVRQNNNMIHSLLLCCHSICCLCCWPALYCTV